MRTTLSLPEELYREVKVVAARAGTTVSSFVADALRVAVARVAGPAADSPLPVFNGGTGFAPGVESSTYADLIELIEVD